jgi:hypothetical protein
MPSSVPRRRVRTVVPAAGFSPRYHVRRQPRKGGRAIVQEDVAFAQPAAVWEQRSEMAARRLGFERYEITPDTAQRRLASVAGGRGRLAAVRVTVDWRGNGQHRRPPGPPLPWARAVTRPSAPAAGGTPRSQPFYNHLQPKTGQPGTVWDIAQTKNPGKSGVFGVRKFFETGPIGRSGTSPVFLSVIKLQLSVPDRASLLQRTCRRRRRQRTRPTKPATGTPTPSGV